MTLRTTKTSKCLSSMTTRRLSSSARLGSTSQKSLWQVEGRAMLGTISTAEENTLVKCGWNSRTTMLARSQRRWINQLIHLSRGGHFLPTQTALSLYRLASAANLAHYPLPLDLVILGRLPDDRCSLIPYLLGIHHCDKGVQLTTITNPRLSNMDGL